MKYFLTFVVVAFFSVFSFTQVMVELDIKTADYLSGKKLAGVTVEIMDGATSVKSSVTPSNGNVKFSVPAGKKYKVEFSKAGKVSRYLIVDAKGIQAELIQGANGAKMQVEVSLFDQVANIDYSFIENNPITEFYFDGSNPSLVYDDAMSAKMRKKIETLMAEAEKKDSQNDALYQKAIEGADAWYKEKKFDLALAKYEEASLLKPKEQYPKDKIKELDALVKSQKQANLATQQKDDQYKGLISAADALRDQKKYAEAITKYNEALKVKDEQYAKDQIASVTKIVEKAKKDAETEAAYKALISSADMFYNQKSFLPAKDKYEEALKLRPGDPYAKKRFDELELKLKGQMAEEEKKKKYNFYISEGQEMIDAKKYAQAKDMYNQAIALDGTQQLPKDKLKEIDVLIAEDAKNTDAAIKFRATMKLGDDLLAANKLTEAKAKYQEAALLEPTETSPKEKIAQVDKMITQQAEMAKNKAKITALLKDANALYAKNDLEKAKTTFQEVLKLEETNAEATTKVQEITAKLNQLQNQAQLEEKFKSLKAKGIEQFKAGNFVEAKTAFTESKAIKADTEVEKYLSDTDKKILENQAYQKLMDEALALEATSIDGAILKYKEALAKKPTSEQAKTKISDLEKIKANQAEIEKKYQVAFKKGLDAINSKKYSEALSAFNEALVVKPSDKEALAKIEEVKKLDAEAVKAKIAVLLKDGNALILKNELENAKIPFQEVIKLDATNAEAIAKLKEISTKIEQQQSLAQQEEKFKNFKAKGIELFKVENLTEAKQNFLDAKAIKADPEVDKYLKDIEQKVADDLAYKKLMQEAASLETSNIDGAISKYNEALVKKPTSAEAKTKIADLQKIKANQAEIDKKYQTAIKKGDDALADKKFEESITFYNEAQTLKPSEKEPATKIAEAKKLEEEALKSKIAGLLKDGNALILKNELENAKMPFQEVLKLDAANSEATTKLKEINTKINQLQSQAQLDEKFKALKTKGVEEFKQDKLNEAKVTFNEAKTIKTDAEIDSYLKDIDLKLTTEQAYQTLITDAAKLETSNVDGAITKYKEALTKKPTSELAKNKISELEKVKTNQANQAEIDKKYQAVMKKANDLFAAKNYLDAIKSYNEALGIKPDEKEPVEKAAEAQRLEEANKSEVDKQYQKILEVGQKAIDDKSWEKAKEMYNRALNLRPDDQNPKNKLKEIDALIKAEQDAKLNAAEKDKEYNLKITEGEKAAAQKEFDKAISLFQNAQTIKPDEKLPPKRIQEITELKNKDLDASKQEALYLEYINKGNAALANKSYDNALTEYQNALNLKQNDKVATAKIAEVKQLMDNDANQEAFQKTKAQFDALVKEGDDLYAAKNWKEARTKYEAALALMAGDKYAKNQVDACIKNIKNKPDEDIQYQKIISKADDYFGKTKYDKAKELYERALSLKGSDPYPKQKLDEIQAILNPVLVKEPTPLNILGEPTTEDPQKVHEALIKAELERKNKKNTKLKSSSEKIDENSTLTSTNKNEQILNSANNISEIEKKKQIVDTRADEKRQNTVEEVKSEETKITGTTIELNSQKYSESQNNKDFVNNVTAESNVISTESSGIYLDKSQSVKTLGTGIQQQDYADNNVSYNKNIEFQGKLAKTQVQVDEKVGDDFDTRKAAENNVLATSKSVSKINDANIVKESDNILDISVKMEDETKKQSSKFTEDTKKSGNNDEGLKNVEQSIAKDQFESSQKTTENSYKADEVVSKNQVNLYGITTEQDKVRSNNVDAMQGGTKAIEEVQRVDNSKNKEKNLDHQNKLATTIVKQDVIKDNEKVNLDKKIDAVVQVEKTSTSVLVENSMSDEEQRLGTKSGVSTIEKQNTLVNTEKANKVDNNISSVKTVTDDLSDKKIKANNEKDDQLKSAQGLLDKLSSKQIKFDDKVANELGKLYPEGVSQEVFNQNDENGLLKAVVTRRIVVKNGHGQIYIRTQSLSGLTYSKNGNPSSEFIWQKETQDAKLTKNY